MSVYDDIIGQWAPGYAGYDIVGQAAAAAMAPPGWPAYPYPLGVAIGQQPGGPMPMAVPGVDCPPLANPPLPPVDAFYVEPRCAARARRELLGFDRVCIGPCETVTLSTSPQVLCKPYRLVIPSNIAYQLVILDIVFGKWRLFCNGGAFPAAAFIEGQDDSAEFNPDTVQPGCNVSITLQNISNEKLEFTGGFWAKCVE